MRGLRAGLATRRDAKKSAPWLQAKQRSNPGRRNQNEKGRPVVGRPSEFWLRGRDLNPRPLGYEPNELPDCSTPRHNNL